jgi:hypothetical protein
MTDKLDRFRDLRGKSTSIEERHRAKLLDESIKNPLLPNILSWLAQRLFKQPLEATIEHFYLLDASLIGSIVIQIDLLESNSELSKVASERGTGTKHLQDCLEEIIGDLLAVPGALEYDAAKLQQILNEVASPYPELTSMIEIGSAAVMHRIAKDIDARSAEEKP